LKINTLQYIYNTLPVIDYAVYTPMSQAFKIEHFNLVGRSTHPTQQLFGFVAYTTTQLKAGSETTVEAMITPTLVRYFESSALSTILIVAVVCATHSIETQPATGRLFSL
jgi:hypothetical protein